MLAATERSILESRVLTCSTTSVADLGFRMPSLGDACAIRREIRAVYQHRLKQAKTEHLHKQNTNVTGKSLRKIGSCQYWKEKQSKTVTRTGRDRMTRSGVSSSERARAMISSARRAASSNSFCRRLDSTLSCNHNQPTQHNSRSSPSQDTTAHHSVERVTHTHTHTRSSNSRLAASASSARACSCASCSPTSRSRCNRAVAAGASKSISNYHNKG